MSWRLPLPEAFWELVRRCARDAGASAPGRQSVALRRLLEGFGRGALGQGSYLDDAEMRAAYLRAFLPYEIGKAPYALRQAPERLARLLSGPRLALLDGGCGPGSATLGILALLSAAAPAPPPRIHAALADRSRSALRTARALVEGLASMLGLDVEVSTHAGVLLPGEGTFDIVVLQNALSEVAADPVRQASILERALGLAGAGLVVAIEPADRDRTRLLLGARDEILGRAGARVLAPCLRQGSCPALRDPRDWCFMELPIDVDREGRMGLREATLPRHALKFSYLVLERAGARPAEHAAATETPFRVVSDLLSARGSRELFLCGEPGRVRLRLLTRHASDSNRELRRARRGDILTVTPLPSGDSGRFDLGPESHVARIATLSSAEPDPTPGGDE